jgi:hypothetical protein
MSIHRDERTLAVENAGYRWSYLVLSFGALAIAAYRSFGRGEATWDLLALVVFAGVVNAGYQATQQVLHQRWVVMSLITLIVAAAVAAGMVLSGVGG